MYASCTSWLFALRNVIVCKHINEIYTNFYEEKKKTPKNQFDNGLNSSLEKKDEKSSDESKR